MSILLDSFLLLLVYFSAVFIVFLCFFEGFSFSFIFSSDNRKCIFGLYLAISSTNFYLHWVANFPTLQICLISYRTCVNSHIEHIRAHIKHVSVHMYHQRTINLADRFRSIRFPHGVDLISNRGL